MTLGNVFILGDSYSTYAGWIPEGYAVFYGCGEHYDGNLDSVQKTWWHMLLTETGSKLLQNNSWSGSTVCHTGYGGYQPAQSFVNRIREKVTDGCFEGERVDTVLIFGGTNDCWNNSPVGRVKYDDITEEDLTAYLPAMAKTVGYLRETAPDARVICILNDCLSDEITNGTIEICRHYGAEHVLLEGLEKVSDHPTEKGMKQITEQILSAIA